MRELVEKKKVEIIHVASQYQHADFVTKALPEGVLISPGGGDEFDMISPSDNV